MYKTVRKGDASLQYTILPQTDQFSSSGFPQASGKPRPRVIMYTMGTLMILITIFCTALPFLISQSDQSLFASTVLVMGRVGHNTFLRNSSRSQGKEISVNKSRSMLPLTTPTEVYRKPDFEEGLTSVSKAFRTEEMDFENLTTTDSDVSSTQVWQVSSESSTSVQQTSPATVPLTVPSTLSSTTFKASFSSPPDVTKTPVSASRKAKMPRVTLKLRENETIPQMYMKAGIASYKKGNITTSVLAHGLSLEGLIFKTPEGTIKPWPQRFFTVPSPEFEWKGLNQMPITIYIVLAALALLASVSIILVFYVQRKATRRQRQSVEEPEVDGHEEDKSTLLGGESQETEEKE